MSNNRITCAKKHYFVLEEALIRLGLSSSELLSVYVRGSHLWESCRNSSDWDVVMVMRQAKNRKSGGNKSTPDKSATESDRGAVTRVKSGKFDATVLDEAEFSARLSAHDLPYLLPLWSSGGLGTVRRADGLQGLQLSREKLIASAEATRERDLATAQKHFDKGKVALSKKVLCHCLQCWLAVAQVLEKGEVADYSACNRGNPSVWTCTDSSWLDLKATVLDLTLRPV